MYLRQSAERQRQADEGFKFCLYNRIYGIRHLREGDRPQADDGWAGVHDGVHVQPVGCVGGADLSVGAGGEEHVRRGRGFEPGPVQAVVGDIPELCQRIRLQCCRGGDRDEARQRTLGEYDV